MPVSKEDIANQLEEFKLGRFVASLDDIIAPSVILEPAEDSGSTSSRLGGYPSLPDGVDWPLGTDSKPLAFIAQIDLQSVNDCGTEIRLPANGFLYFFYDTRNLPWGFDPEDRGSWKVMHCDRSADSLREHSPPPELIKDSIFDPLAAKLVADNTVAGYGSQYVDDLNLTEEEENRYLAFEERLEGLRGTGDVINRFMGYPDPVQGNDMDLECQLVSSGIYCGDSSGYDSPKAKLLRAGARDWRLLLQVDSNEDLGMMWGDLGKIYYWIHKDDLAKMDFSNVWLILQCT